MCANGEENRGDAYFYLETKTVADNIGGHIAFWHGVTVEQ